MKTESVSGRIVQESVSRGSMFLLRISLSKILSSATSPSSASISLTGFLGSSSKKISLTFWLNFRLLSPLTWKRPSAFYSSGDPDGDGEKISKTPMTPVESKDGILLIFAVAMTFLGADAAPPSCSLTTCWENLSTPPLFVTCYLQVLLGKSEHPCLI